MRWIDRMHLHGPVGCTRERGIGLERCDDVVGAARMNVEQMYRFLYLARSDWPFILEVVRDDV